VKCKVVYIVSKVDKAVAFEWIVEAFKKSQVELSFILINDNFQTDLSKFLELEGIPTYRFRLKGKSNYPLLLVKIYLRLLRIKPQVVHTHLLEASLLGLTAAKFTSIKKRIYTRHHSTSQHEYFPHAVKYDKLNNQLATHIIAISKNVRNVLISLEEVPSGKVKLIEHGFKLNNFSNINHATVELLREKHQIPEGKKIIGTISRYLKLKGVDYVIEAFKKVHLSNPNVHLLLANAGGGYETVIKTKLSALPKGCYTEISFEPDLFSLYQLIDIYCHVPINNKVEAFGQTYVEALAAGIPSVFTLSGIANDFIKDEINALVVDFENSQQIEIAITKLLREPELSNRLVENGLISVRRFELKEMIEKLKELYLS
jgi:glycosyltransferase involved in cell wall biosynthesis